MNNEQLKEYYFLLKETGRTIAKHGNSKRINSPVNFRGKNAGRLLVSVWESKIRGRRIFIRAEKFGTLKKNVGELEIGLYLNRCYSGILNTYISALSDNKFIDTPNTIDTLNKLRSQLSAVSLKNETALLEQIAFIEAALQDDTKEMLRAIELMVTSKQGNLWILPQILRIVREKKDKTLSSGVKAMKEKILSMLSTRTDKEKFEQLIDDIDK